VVHWFCEAVTISGAPVCWWSDRRTTLFGGRVSQGAARRRYAGRVDAYHKDQHANMQQHCQRGPSGALNTGRLGQFFIWHQNPS